MKVMIKPYFGNEIEMELSAALEPAPLSGVSGAMEELAAETQGLRECVGRLLAHLVETEILTLEQASDMAGLDKPPEPAWES